MEDIPIRFKCPLSRKLMRDPVLANDNVVYDRASLLKYFGDGESKPSPIVPSITIAKSEVQPQVQLRDEILEYTFARVAENASTINAAASQPAQSSASLEPHPSHPPNTTETSSSSCNVPAQPSPWVQSSEHPPAYDSIVDQSSSPASRPVVSANQSTAASSVQSSCTTTSSAAPSMHPTDPTSSLSATSNTGYKPTPTPSTSASACASATQAASSHAGDRPSAEDGQADANHQCSEAVAKIYPYGKSQALLRVNCPQTSTKRTRVHLSLVLDASTSMRAPVTARDENNNRVEYNITLMDLTKFAAQVCVNCLSDEDVVSVVRFADMAETVVEPTVITASKRRVICDMIGHIQAKGRTNLWAGIAAGLSHLHTNNNNAMLNVCMTLTDGEPNRHPANGYKEAQERFLRLPGFEYTLNTLALGYGKIDSTLLQELAQQGHGTFANIPDSGLVGTVFTNMLARAKVTSHTALTLVDEQLVLRNAEPIVGGQAYRQDDSAPLKLGLGSLQLEQERWFLLNLADGVDVKKFRRDQLRLHYHNLEFGSSSTIQVVPSPLADDLVQRGNTAAAMAQAADLLFQLNNLGKINDFKGALSLLQQHLNTSNIAQYAPEARVDLHTEVRLGLQDRETYERWGHSYILSLASAYLHHARHNFKDKAVQMFGGPFFRQVADEMSDVYDTLPTPKPSRTEGRQLTTGAAINTPAGGCYSEGSLVAMADGTEKRCDAIVAGDRLRNGGVVAKVARFEVANGRGLFCQFGPGLFITPYHPIRHAGEWRFPCHVSKPEMINVKYMFSFLLTPESGHVAVVGGIDTITLAHNITDDRVLKHAFFGTDTIRNRLEELAEGSGVVTFGPECMQQSQDGTTLDFDAKSVRVCV
eukprot:TRINITY_DN11315_c0_g2_i1.p1 TRINITY_DN11315_c0_g2~~TRINITY_DN11315_c0_g2_i1.p1  ORF type:complete len:873 (+),score=222.61 TRINITY_DN11315_c0_g2_i1:1578-4196(+)